MFYIIANSNSMTSVFSFPEKSRPNKVRHPSLRLVRFVVVLLLALCGIRNCEASTKLSSSSSSSSSKATLTFSAQCQLLAEPFCDDPYALREFLERPHIRNLFLSAGGERPCQVLPVVPNDLRDNSIAGLWRQACQKYYGSDALPKVLLIPAATADTTSTIHQSRRRSIKDHLSHTARGQQQQRVEISALVTETEAQFPGFKMINTVVNGCQLFPPAEDTTATTTATSRSNTKKGRGLQSFLFSGKKGPTGGSGGDDDDDVKDKNKDLVYSFHLIGDKKRMEGPKPVVWLVQKLMGDGGDETTTTTEDDDVTTTPSYRPSETRAITQVSIYTQESSSSVSVSPSLSSESSISISETTSTSTSTSTPQEGEELTPTAAMPAPTVGFRLDIECAIQIEFPKLLLRLLPASRSKVEERGTKAIRKAILQDATSAVEAVQEAWLKEQQEKNAVLLQQQRSSRRPLKKTRGLPSFARLLSGNKDSNNNT